MAGPWAAGNIMRRRWHRLGNDWPRIAALSVIPDNPARNTSLNPMRSGSNGSRSVTWRRMADGFRHQPEV